MIYSVYVCQVLRIANKYNTQSPVFRDAENGQKTQNLGRKENSQNFKENKIFMPKMSKY